jgi:hypothetical protein
LVVVVVSNNSLSTPRWSVVVTTASPVAVHFYFFVDYLFGCVCAIKVQSEIRASAIS